MNRLIIIMMVLFFPIISLGQTKLFPKNEVYKDSSLTNFICKLQYAIFKKDKEFLLSIIDKDIENDFGGGHGIENFKQTWFKDSTDSEVWFYLSKLISLGGTFSDYPTEKGSKTSFVFPYVFTAEISDPSLDPFNFSAITGSSVNVREKPNKSSKITGKLTYDIVRVDYEKSYPLFEDKKFQGVNYYGEKEWYYITSLDKKISGYVYWDYIWSFADYRLFLNKTEGQWKITCFIAGD